MHHIILAAAFLSQVSSPRPNPPIDSIGVREVLDRWAAGVGLIESYDLCLERHERTFFDTDKKDGSLVFLGEQGALKFPTTFSRIYRKGSKRRGEFGGDGKAGYLSHIIWDGQQGYSYQGSNSVNVAPYVATFGIEYEDYEARYRTFLGTTDRIALSKDRDSRLLPREGRFYVVDVPTTTKGDYSNAHWRVWLDPDRNYLPAKLREWMATRGVERHTLDIQNDLSEVAAGVWMPMRSMITTSVDDTKSLQDGGVGMTSELVVVADRSKFNVDLPDSLFDPKIPNGTTVIDRARNAVYTQGSSDANQYLGEMAAAEKQKLASVPPIDREPPSMIFIPNNDRPRWFIWGSVAGASLLLLLGANRLRRSRRMAT